MTSRGPVHRADDQIEQVIVTAAAAERDVQDVDLSDPDRQGARHRRVAHESAGARSCSASMRGRRFKPSTGRSSAHRNVGYYQHFWAERLHYEQADLLEVLELLPCCGARTCG
jgi:hypothetical protein